MFLTRGVRSFYTDDFYEQMQEVFASPGLAEDLRDGAAADDYEHMAAIIRTYAGQLGIDSGTRNFHILSGDTGEWLAGSTQPENGIEITPNIITAIQGGNGYSYDPDASYMDVALPVEGGRAGYIIYVVDNKATMTSLNDQLISIIVDALIVGLVISVLLCLLLARAITAPVQDSRGRLKRWPGGTSPTRWRTTPRTKSECSPAHSTTWPCSWRTPWTTSRSRSRCAGNSWQTSRTS